MVSVRIKVKEIFQIRTILIIVFLFSFTFPSLCGASGLINNDSILISPQKKFINHYFNATEFHRRGELDKALEEYKKAYEYDSSNMMILNSIGRVYWKMGELEKAAAIYREVLNKSSSKDTEARARSSLGVIYMDQGNYEKALEELQRCLDLDPDSSKKVSYKTIINKCMAEID